VDAGAITSAPFAGFAQALVWIAATNTSGTVAAKIVRVLIMIPPCAGADPSF
jgi:hypothetical protein